MYSTDPQETGTLTIPLERMCEQLSHDSGLRRPIDIVRILRLYKLDRSGRDAAMFCDRMQAQGSPRRAECYCRGMQRTSTQPMEVVSKYSCRILRTGYQRDSYSMDSPHYHRAYTLVG